jgi:hypothetical protein
MDLMSSAEAGNAETEKRMTKNSARECAEKKRRFTVENRMQKRL